MKRAIAFLLLVLFACRAGAQAPTRHVLLVVPGTYAPLLPYPLRP